MKGIRVGTPPRVLFYVFFCMFSWLQTLSPAYAQEAIAAIVYGRVFHHKGNIRYSRPQIGETVRVNSFGQYRDQTPNPAWIEWAEQISEPLKTNARFGSGWIIETKEESFAKLLLSNNSVVDLGPETVLKIERFVDAGQMQDVHLKMLKGNIRCIVAADLKPPQQFLVTTPNAEIRVRGTEFIVSTSKSNFEKTLSEIVSIHGQVTVDLLRNDLKGMVFAHQYVIRPSSVLTTEGFNGFGHTINIHKVSQAELRFIVKKLGPLTNVYASVMGSRPIPGILPGTGVAKGRGVASPNFHWPERFQAGASNLWAQPDLRSFTGTPPISPLPHFNPPKN